MKGMHFIVVEDGAMAGTGQVKQGVGNDKYLCEFPQQTGVRLSRIMPADNMVEWLFFNNANSLQAYMQSQIPPPPPADTDDKGEGMDDETNTDEESQEEGGVDATAEAAGSEAPDPLDE